MQKLDIILIVILEIFNHYGSYVTIKHTSSLAKICEEISDDLNDLRVSGLYKNERIITSGQNSWININERENKVLNFCANNYLGLSKNFSLVYQRLGEKIAQKLPDPQFFQLKNHPEVVESGINTLKKYGAGLSSVRFICGTQDIHKNLEKKISLFHNREDTILYPSCFDANSGLFEVLCNENDAIISDELNHASIIDGIRLSKAKRYRYKHRDMNDLENILKNCANYRRRLIATDGVFSMDGNISPLDKICALAERYNALVFVDDCHATGFFGKTGRGTEEYFDIIGKVDIINSTLGKALGGASGGYTTTTKEIVALLRNKSRPYLFSNSLPPSIVGCANKVFDILLDKSEQYSNKISSLTKLFRENMLNAGFTILGDQHPICPILLGDAKLATIFADKMLEKDIYVIGFSYPVVPKDKARIRIQISAGHTEDDIERAVNAFIDVGKELHVIK